MTRVKICCISSLEEAELALRYGADALGFVSLMPSGEGMLADDPIRELASAFPDSVRFLLTCKRNPAEIAAQVRAVGTDTVQLVDRMEIADLIRLRDELPGVSLVQVVHVCGPGAVAEAQTVEPYVDTVLLDSGAPDAPVRTLGGTGRVHDWELSAEIVRKLSCPVYLAGGLGPDNVAAAIRQVRPFGVDLCSRLRPQGRLDESLLASFIDAVRTVDTGL